MSARRHGVALALLLGTASVAGAYATITTASLHSATKPEVVASAAIAKRQARLDAWEASLRRALASKPPQLPALPHYGHAAGVRSPSYRALPAPVAVRGTQKSTPAPATVTAPPRTRAPRPAKKRPVPSLRPTRTATPQTVPRTAIAPVPPPVAQEPAPAVPTPSPAAPAPAPAVTPLSQPATAAPPMNDAEQQCAALKQAAQGQGETARRAAERQCDALLHPGGEGGEDDD